MNVELQVAMQTVHEAESQGDPLGIFHKPCGRTRSRAGRVVANVDMSPKSWLLECEEGLE